MPTDDPTPPRRRRLSDRLAALRRPRDPRQPGATPGALIHVGPRRTESVRFKGYRYAPGGQALHEFASESADEAIAFLRGGEGVCWLQVIGLHEPGRISPLLDARGIHPLIQEDIFNTNHRPACADQGDYLFVIFRQITGGGAAAIESEQFSGLLFPDAVITFHESLPDELGTVEARLQREGGRLRQSGSDYLLWAILDVIADHYLEVIARTEDEVEALDEMLESDSPSDLPARLLGSQRELSYLRRHIRPARDIAGQLERADSKLICASVRLFLRDLYDHAAYAAEAIEHLRESVLTLREMHMATVNNRMNEVMKVLTCIATIFLPLTFLAGVYGMNFKSMPEFRIGWFYPALWLAFAAIAGVMLVIFRKKKWL